MTSLGALAPEFNSASSTQQYTLNIDLLRLRWSYQATAILSSIRLLLLPRWVLHDKWEASSSLVQYPLWLCIILYYRLKALSHPRREKKGCWTFLANESLCSTTCNLVIPQAAPAPCLLYPHPQTLRPPLTSPLSLDLRLHTGKWIDGISAC